jgi:cell division septum initiation protein DivIVA
VTVQDQVARLRRAVAGARAMPMSASAVVNRAELLGLIDELAGALDAELAGARQVVSAKDELVNDGKDEAARLLDEARDERERLASDTEVLKAAQAEAEAVVAEARREADGLRREADDYVDSTLATFEITLERTLHTVRRGRRRLAGEGDLDALGRDER